MSAVADVQTYLAAQGLVDGATQWPSVRRTMGDDADPDQPSRLVGIMEDGGPPPDIPADQGVGVAADVDPGVQVLVRGAPWDGDGCVAQCEAIRTALHGLQDATLGATTYIRVRAMTPQPVWLGYDGKGRPTCSVAFRLLAPAP